MNLLNSALRVLFDLLLYPFQALPAAVGLLVVSALAAMGMLWVFKRTSNQERLEAVKRQIHAGLFEIRLFNDSFRRIWSAQLGILRNNVTYLRLSLVPMLFILPPLALVVAQLQFHYAYAAPAAGDQLVLTATLDEGWQDSGEVPVSASGKPQATLELPAGLVAETPSLWTPADRMLSWRLRVEQPGDHVLGIHIGDQQFSKDLAGSRPLQRRSPVKPGRSWVDQFIYPAEVPLPADGVLANVALDLAPAEVALPGWKVQEMAGVPAWMTVFFIFSIVFAYALRKRFGVVF
ncbi:MAG: hypothetical protein K8J08_06385 [Thermoanaerobaculia bacterium]|nr:hypothetical protein [Thermoanaerobaculia bacterium]